MAKRENLDVAIEGNESVLTGDGVVAGFLVKDVELVVVVDSTKVKSVEE